MDSHEIWKTAWQALGVDARDSFYAELESRLQEPHRAYHTRQHIDECFRRFEPIRDQADWPETVELAIWYHDAVYDPKSHDSEEQSAALAARHLSMAGLDKQVCDRVAQLVLATKHLETPDTTDAILLVDTDLSILAAPSPRFEEYEQQIRSEYGWVPDSVYRRERSRILHTFLDRPRLYASNHFFEQLECKARENIQSLLTKLRR